MYRKKTKILTTNCNETEDKKWQTKKTKTKIGLFVKKCVQTE